MRYGIFLSAMALSGANGFVSSPHHRNLSLSSSTRVSMASSDRDDDTSSTTTSESSSSSAQQKPNESAAPKPATPPQAPATIAPSPELMMRALNTSPRRIFLGTLSSTGIALSANFFGVTSNLLNTIPEPIVESSGLDQLYPRGNYKRYKSAEYGYSFVVPKEWVQDTAVELAKIQRRAGNLDYTMKRPTGASIPDVAYGPLGYFNEKGISQSDTNLSAITTKLGPGVSLKGLLGSSPKDAAETLLRVSLTPEGSGKVGTLLDAQEETRGMGNVYTLEYKVDRGEKGLPLRAISIIAVQGGDLITYTVVAPAKDWVGDYEMMLRKMADSFKLTR